MQFRLYKINGPLICAIADSEQGEKGHFHFTEDRTFVFQFDKCMQYIDSDIKFC